LPSDRPIFVVGCPRSGTTLLQLMLHAHPRIAIPPETRFALKAYDMRRSFGDLADPANRRKLGEWITGPGNSFKDLGLDAHDIIEQIVAGPGTLGSAMGIVFRAYAERFGKARWGDKRPAYLLHLDILLWLFPDAQIIHIIRDGRDCVASMKDQPWFKGGLNHAISQWVRGMEAGWRASKKLTADQYYEVYYERLVADPENELRKLCDFIGEEYDDAMAEPSRVASVAVPERKVWHELTHGAVTSERVGSWQQRLKPGEIGLCEAIMARQLEARGYEVVGDHRVSMRRRYRYVRHAVKDTIRRSRRSWNVRLDRLRRPTEFASAIAGPPAIGQQRDSVDAAAPK
jgi:LPS sulfotransferase NodH